MIKGTAQTSTRFGKSWNRIGLAFAAFAICFVMIHFVACHDNALDSSDQPLIQYTVFVTDSVTGLPIDSAAIELITISLDTIKSYSNSQGRIDLPSVESGQNLILLTRYGYQPLDIYDSVQTARDTVFFRAKPIVLHLQLVPISGVLDSSRWIQARIGLRTESFQALRGGIATFTDSLGQLRQIGDIHGDGEIRLQGLAAGKNTVRIEQAGYLGRWISIQASAHPSDSTVNTNYISLQPLSQVIRGQIFSKVPGKGVLPLGSARVLFTLSDSSFYPRSFETLTYDSGDSLGYYVLDSIPEMGGKISIYLNSVSREPSAVLEISKSEVTLAKSQAAIVLDPSEGLTDKPLLVKAPADTIEAGDTLVFQFNQAVDTIVTLSIRQVNSALPLLTPFTQSADKKFLRVTLKDSPWTKGYLFTYTLALKNSVGDAFLSPGLTRPGVQGFFYVRNPQLIDTTRVFPSNFRITAFNSATDIRFDSTQDNSSALPDSTTNFAKLQWSWPTGTSISKQVDSVLIYIRDTRTYSQWSLFRMYPAALDSLVLLFSDIYSTASFPSTVKAQFPLSLSRKDSLWIEILPKHGNQVYFTRDTVLNPLTWAMGQSVYARFSSLDSLKVSGNASDSIHVTFHASPMDSTHAIELDTATVHPKLFSSFSGFTEWKNLFWVWDSSKTKGYIIYSLSAGQNLQNEWIRLDVQGQNHLSRPLFHRNRNQKVFIRP